MIQHIISQGTDSGRLMLVMTAIMRSITLTQLH